MSQRKPLPTDQITSTVNDANPHQLDGNPEQDNLVACYKASNPLDRQRLLNILNKQEMAKLYTFYLHDLENAVAKLEGQDHTGKDIARQLFTEVHSIYEEKYTKKRFNEFDDHLLFDVIHQTTDMIKQINPDNSIKQEFFPKLKQFEQTSQKLMASSKSNRLSGIFTALQIAIAAAAIIAMTALAVVTYGMSLYMIPAFIGSAALIGLITVPSALQAHSFLTESRKEKSIATRMDELQGAIELRNAP